MILQKQRISLLRELSSIGYEMKAFHIPKTIDNDLLETDHCPGYGFSSSVCRTCFSRVTDADNRKSQRESK
jgi:6-phosphofructokinase 1